MAWLRPGEALTRHVVATGQVLTSALLIHLTGGRIETHFHVFGSLGFFSRSTAMEGVGSCDGLRRGRPFLARRVLPASVYPSSRPRAWALTQHTVWVLFEDFFLFIAIRSAVAQMGEAAEHSAPGALGEQTELRGAGENPRAGSRQDAARSHPREGRLSREHVHEIRTPMNAIIGMTGLLPRRTRTSSSATTPLSVASGEQSLTWSTRSSTSRRSSRQARARQRAVRPAAVREEALELVAVQVRRKGARAGLIELRSEDSATASSEMRAD